ncbi:MAG: hypothetical protein WBI53_09275 [Paludibacter sp.]
MADDLNLIETTKLEFEVKKGKNTIYRKYSAEEITAMNRAKRRRLEDLGILPRQR